MFQGLWDFRIGSPYGSHLLCIDPPHPCVVVLSFTTMFESGFILSTYPLIFHLFNIISPRLFFSTSFLCFHAFSFCPVFINIPCWVVCRSSYWFSSWFPTILGLMTNPTTTIASYSLTICNSMTNMVACPTSDRVAGISNIPSHIASAVEGFVSKIITRITITIKTIYIPRNLVPSWDCFLSKSALRSGANSLMNSFKSSWSDVFCVLCRSLESNFSFKF